MKNLEKRIYRQRLHIQAKYNCYINKRKVSCFLHDLTNFMGMNLITKIPIITSATGKTKPIHNGFEGVIVWAESGVQVYIWENYKFLTIDIYSCKKFDNKQALDFCSSYFVFKKSLWRCNYD